MHATSTQLRAPLETGHEQRTPTHSSPFAFQDGCRLPESHAPTWERSEPGRHLRYAGSCPRKRGPPASILSAREAPVQCESSVWAWTQRWPHPRGNDSANRSPQVRARARSCGLWTGPVPTKEQATENIAPTPHSRFPFVVTAGRAPLRRRRTAGRAVRRKRWLWAGTGTPGPGGFDWRGAGGRHAEPAAAGS